jgi:hypothetical protein
MINDLTKITDNLIDDFPDNLKILTASEVIESNIDFKDLILFRVGKENKTCLDPSEIKDLCSRIVKADRKVYKNQYKVQDK